jgi:methylase of polypeptide subunit release factors
MLDQYNLVVQLTSPELSDIDRPRILNDFAYELGWQPSDRLGGLIVGDFANAHLVVEHGLENTAVITFLRDPRRYADLDYSEKRRLLTISYNNLVDWHIQVEIDGVTFVFNRTKPPRIVERHHISRGNVDTLRSEAFERVVGKKPSPNLPALDDALIETISFWKRNLSAEMGYAVPNGSLSALFNAIIFVRAVEDHYWRLGAGGVADQHETDSSRVLLRAWGATSTLTLREVILQHLERFIGGEIPAYVINEEQLYVFDDLDRQTVYALFSDFYRSKYVPYEYDFSLMSKHALSRIYERYVSILHLEESPQATLPLFPRLPEEEWNKAYGSIYTPQFIARFFARYLREQMPPLAYRRIRTADPACGSGIFLRTLLELQCDPTYDGMTTELIQTVFGNVLGLDFDENACQATRLSLALLHLILTSRLPQTLNVYSEESIKYYVEHPKLKGSYDAVIANPPFVSLDTQTPAMRERVSQFMNDHATGRIDMYLAFLRIGLEMLKPGGYGLFVLPHSFLLGKNASGMRKLISETAWIRCLADLSAIRVFEDRGSYIVLLIFQRRPDTSQKAPPATIVKCQDLVGRALQDVIDGRRLETSFYSIYDVEQDTFRKDEWLVLPPTESSIRRRFETLPTVDDFLHVRQGFISGADSVFIVSAEQISMGEASLFVPFLPDRDMRLYTVPNEPSRYFLYPYLDGRVVEEDKLKERFPKTWEYLQSHKHKLESRAPVRNGQLDWWRPVRPRPPERMMRPKIVSPHLVLVPRFSLDREGKYAISRAPLLYPKETGTEDDLLRFFIAVLNSTPCYWHIATHSHVYRGGYVMLEPKTLKKTPVPDPTQISPVTKRRLLALVDRRLLLSGPDALDVEKQIDALVADLYGLSSQERQALGMED